MNRSELMVTGESLQVHLFHWLLLSDLPLEILSGSRSAHSSSLASPSIEGPLSTE